MLNDEHLLRELPRLCARRIRLCAALLCALLALAQPACALRIAAAEGLDPEAVQAVEAAQAREPQGAADILASEKRNAAPVRIAVVESYAGEPKSRFIAATVERLRSGLRPRPIQIQPLAASEIDAYTPQGRLALATKYDLLIAPSEILLQDETLGGFTRLVTKARRAGDRYAAARQSSSAPTAPICAPSRTWRIKRQRRPLRTCSRGGFRSWRKSRRSALTSGAFSAPCNSRAMKQQ